MTVAPPTSKPAALSVPIPKQTRPPHRQTREQQVGFALAALIGSSECCAGGLQGRGHTVADCPAVRANPIASFARSLCPMKRVGESDRNRPMPRDGRRIVATINSRLQTSYRQLLPPCRIGLDRQTGCLLAQGEPCQQGRGHWFRRPNSEAHGRLWSRRTSGAVVVGNPASRSTRWIGSPIYLGELGGGLSFNKPCRDLRCGESPSQ